MALGFPEKERVTIMKIFFAGNGKKQEDDELLLSMPERKDSWGVLLTYKDMQLKENNGNARFQKIAKRKKVNKDAKTVVPSGRKRKKRSKGS